MRNRRGRAERRIAALAAEVAALRARLPVLDEQVGFLDQVSAEAETQAVVGGDHVSAREHRAAASDLDRARRERAEVAARIVALQAEQDRLLDDLLG
jgi:hypothetical protein